MVVIGSEERGVDRGERCGLGLLKSRNKSEFTGHSV